MNFERTLGSLGSLGRPQSRSLLQLKRHEKAMGSVAVMVDQAALKKRVSLCWKLGRSQVGKKQLK